MNNIGTRASNVATRVCNTATRVGNIASSAAELAGDYGKHALNRIRHNRLYQIMNPYDLAFQNAKQTWASNAVRNIRAFPGALGEGLSNLGRNAMTGIRGIDSGITNTLGDGLLGKGYRFGKSVGSFATSGFEMLGTGLSSAYNLLTNPVSTI